MTADSIILIIGAVMVLITFIFWYIELQPAIKRLIEINKHYQVAGSANVVHKSANQIAKMGALLGLIPLMIPFIIDMMVTSSLTSIFSFGGTVGGILGLFISDMFSIIILFVMMTSRGSKN
jgi:hypothetical protein